MLPVYAALLASAVVVVSFIYGHLFHPLRKFPGPFWAAHTDLWRVYHLWTRRMPETLLQMHEKYGPVVRIAPNELSFQSVDILGDVYKGGRKFPKSDFYQGFTTFHPNTFGMLDEEVSTLSIWRFRNSKMLNRDAAAR
jgi:benzoate 4-monooxygenase